MIRLTKSGALFLGVAVLLYGASLTSQSGLLLLPIGVLLACFIINAIESFRVVRNVEVHPPATAHLSEGQRMTQSWRLRNRRRQVASLIEVQSKAGTVLRVGALNPGAETSVLPELIYLRRGVYANSRVQLCSRHPFGFVQASRTLDLPGEVIVHPALYETPTVRAAGYDAVVGGKYKGRRRTMSGTHFAGVRPAQPGDPLKQIHWKSSAKGQGLMVKTFEEELSGRVAVIMDCGTSGDEKLLDDCVRATGSIIFHSLDEGHHVEWIDLNRLEAQLFPPFMDGQVILDELARIELKRDCLTEEHLRKAIASVSPRAALCFVLTGYSPVVGRIIDELLGQQRVASIYLPDKVAVPADFHGAPLFVYDERHIAEPA